MWILSNCRGENAVRASRIPGCELHIRRHQTLTSIVQLLGSVAVRAETVGFALLGLIALMPVLLREQSRLLRADGLSANSLFLATKSSPSFL